MRTAPAPPPLLALLRGAPAAAIPAAAWPTIKAQAEEHALVPLLWTQHEAVLPRALRDAWRPRMHRLASTNFLLEMETQTLLGGLAAQGIPAVELKGVSLARRLYGSPTAREVTDIDLLVREANLPTAAEWLLAAGWERDERARSTREARRDHHHLIFRHENRALPLLLELHWNLSPPSHFQLTTDAIWRHVHQAPGSGWQLAPELELVALALHLFQHNFSPLARVVDLANFIRTTAPGWDLARLEALCAHSTRRRLVTLAALVATQVLVNDTPLAMPLPAPLDGWTDRRIRLAARTLAPPALLARPLFDYSRYYQTSLLAGEVRVAGERARRSLLYPGGWERAPAWQRLLHPLRLLGRYSHRVWQSRITHRGSAP